MNITFTNDEIDRIRAAGNDARRKWAEANPLPDADDLDSREEFRQVLTAVLREVKTISNEIEKRKNPHFQ